MGASRSEKELYFTKLKELLAKYPSIFIVNVDNVGSNQMHQIRVALRGKGTVLMGKNTMVRRALRSILRDSPQFGRLLPHVKGKVGLVFTSGDLRDVREIIISNKVAAPARVGAYSPKDIIIPAGITGVEPGKLPFCSSLRIPTRTTRGTTEICMDVKLVAAGTRVGRSEAIVLKMLSILPFTYVITVVRIYDRGNIYSPDILDVGEQELVDRFLSGIRAIAAVSLATRYPTIVSVNHSLVNAYKNLLAFVLATDYCFDGAEKAKGYLEAFTVTAESAPAAKPEPAEEPDEDTWDFISSISL